jgi:hypothetical protein
MFHGSSLLNELLSVIALECVVDFQILKAVRGWYSKLGKRNHLCVPE